MASLSPSVAFCNIGLAGSAFDGKGWKRHKARFINHYTDLLKENEYTLVLFPNEVGIESTMEEEQNRKERKEDRKDGAEKKCLSVQTKDFIVNE